jgi:hypothetical protein
MKFALVMYICSVVAGQCGDGIKDPMVYPTHKDCAIAGYTKSLEIITDMDETDVNKNKLFFSFTCTQANYS